MKRIKKITYSTNSNNERNKEKPILIINECCNAFESVKAHRLQNPENVIIGHLNVNSLRNKITAVEELMRNKIDICLFSETKLDETFPNSNLRFMAIKCIAETETNMAAEFFAYVNENIPCEMVSAEGVPEYREIILIQFSIKTRKWLCIGLYKPPSQNDKYFLDTLSLILNKLTFQFDNIMLMGDFKLTVENKNLEVFMRTFDMKCLIKRTTCFQSAKPNCIDLILTNKNELFKNSNVSKAGISDHHSFIVTALKSHLRKGNAKMKLYL